MRTFPRTARYYTGERSVRRTTPRGGSVAEQLGASLIGRVSRQNTLVCHYDARDIDAADGATVAAWSDRAGAQDLAQATEANKPTFSATGWGGGPAVSFGASAGMSSLFASGIPSESISVVALCTSGAAAEGTALEYTGNVYNNRGFSLLVDAGVRRAELGADSARSYAEGGDAIGDARIAVGMVGDRSTSNDTLVLYGEDGAITPSSSGFVDGSGDHESAYLYVGSRLANGTRALDGLIRSIIAFEEPLGADEMQTVLDGMVATGSGLAAVESAGAGGASVEYNFDEVHDSVVTDDDGTLYDDGGPDGAYSSDEYWVTIDAPPGQQVELTFVSFELGNPGAWYERLRVWDNNASSGTILGEFYGSMSAGGANAPTSGQTLTSTNGHVFIRQDSSTSGVNDGFKITWRFV